MNIDAALAPLADFLRRIPAVSVLAGRTDESPDGRWWVKLVIDIRHPLAWGVVQELAHVLNYLSVEERLPTVFMPVSPPPYLNGGPEYLSWVIESTDPSFTPDKCVEWLEGRLPRPVDDISEWRTDDDEEDEPGTALGPSSDAGS